MAKTIAVFGAGGGMGLSLARRFGQEGYRVALVARRREPLDQLVAELAADDIEAAAFVADLRRTEDVPALVASIRARFGRIDAVVYSPFSPATLIPAAELDAATLRDWVDLYLLTPVELVHAVLPEMLERRAGAIVTGYGYSVLEPSAGLSGPVPVLAAARNYIHTLHDELAEHGVYAGAVAVRALIDRSEAHQAVRSGDMRLAVDLPVIDPDELADLVWALVRRRDLVEVVHP
ncbi:SDR family NAD(P)-dependent oxidoreductase [Streptosporangium sp. NPDC002544]|uniref:SDR family NAD(P)-dependent oxidoreductase n=1 Tax=Streptosporangium sp. NPDC002544 TaxID=3154538 RepID=UPI00333364FF